MKAVNNTSGPDRQSIRRKLLFTNATEQEYGHAALSYKVHKQQDNTAKKSDKQNTAQNSKYEDILIQKQKLEQLLDQSNEFNKRMLNQLQRVKQNYIKVKNQLEVSNQQRNKLAKTLQKQKIQRREQGKSNLQQKLLHYFKQLQQKDDTIKKLTQQLSDLSASGSTKSQKDLAQSRTEDPAWAMALAELRQLRSRFRQVEQQNFALGELNRQLKQQNLSLGNQVGRLYHQCNELAIRSHTYDEIINKSREQNELITDDYSKRIEKLNRNVYEKQEHVLHLEEKLVEISNDFAQSGRIAAQRLQSAQNQLHFTQQKLHKSQDKLRIIQERFKAAMAEFNFNNQKLQKQNQQWKEKAADQYHELQMLKEQKQKILKLLQEKKEIVQKQSNNSPHLNLVKQKSQLTHQSSGTTSIIHKLMGTSPALHKSQVNSPQNCKLSEYTNVNNLILKQQQPQLKSQKETKQEQFQNVFKSLVIERNNSQQQNKNNCLQPKYLKLKNFRLIIQQLKTISSLLIQQFKQQTLKTSSTIQTLRQYLNEQQANNQFLICQCKIDIETKQNLIKGFEQKYRVKQQTLKMAQQQIQFLQNSMIKQENNTLSLKKANNDLKQQIKNKQLFVNQMFNIVNNYEIQICQNNDNRSNQNQTIQEYKKKLYNLTFYYKNKYDSKQQTTSQIPTLNLLDQPQHNKQQLIKQQAISQSTSGKLSVSLIPPLKNDQNLAQRLRRDRFQNMADCLTGITSDLSEQQQAKQIQTRTSVFNLPNDLFQVMNKDQEIKWKNKSEQNFTATFGEAQLQISRVSSYENSGSLLRISRQQSIIRGIEEKLAVSKKVTEELQNQQEIKALQQELARLRPFGCSFIFKDTVFRHWQGSQFSLQRAIYFGLLRWLVLQRNHEKLNLLKKMGARASVCCACDQQIWHKLQQTCKSQQQLCCFIQQNRQLDDWLVSVFMRRKGQRIQDFIQKIAKEMHFQYTKLDQNQFQLGQPNEHWFTIRLSDNGLWGLSSPCQCTLTLKQ